MAGNDIKTQAPATAALNDGSPESMLQQAYNKFNRSMSSAKNDKDRREAFKELLNTANAVGLFDETKQIGAKFAKVAGDLKVKLKQYQQDIENEAARKSVETEVTRINGQLGSVKSQIDTQFNLEKSGFTSSVSFAGIGRAVCSFLRACGVDGMDEYIDNFTKEIRAANDSIRDVKYGKLDAVRTVVAPDASLKRLERTTDAAVATIGQDAGEITDLAGQTAQAIGQVLKPTASAPAAPASAPATPSAKKSPLVSTTRRAVELAEKAATEMGIKDPKRVGTIVQAAAQNEGDPGKLTLRELDEAEKKLITGVGKKEAHEVIERIKKEVGFTAPQPT